MFNLFLKAYASCIAGVDYIGWILMIIFGLAAIIAPVIGKVTPILTSIPIYTIYYIGIFGIFTVLLLWENFSQRYLLFVFGIIFSIIESINTTQTRGKFLIK